MYVASFFRRVVNIPRSLCLVVAGVMTVNWTIIAKALREAACHGGAWSMEQWRHFRKRFFYFCWTTYYSTVAVTCTQTRSHRTQSLHCDKSLKWGLLRFIVTTNFAAMIYHGDISFRSARYHCNKVSLHWYLGEISRRLCWYLADLSF